MFYWRGGALYEILDYFCWGVISLGVYGVLVAIDHGCAHDDFETAVEIGISLVDHLAALHLYLEQINLQEILITTFFPCKLDFWNAELVVDGLGRQQLGNFEVVDEEIITVIIVDHIEIDEFVDEEILMSCKLFGDQVGNLVHGVEGTIVVIEFRVDDIELILHNELVKDYLHLNWLKE